MSVQTSSHKGFTLIELTICVSIFVFMTVLLIVKYGTFNQSTLLTDLTYDLALVMRQAQTYGLSVVNASTTSATFQFPYGISFSTTALKPTDDQNVLGSTRAILFADSYNSTLQTAGSDGIYTYTLGNAGQSDMVENIYNLTRGAYISSLCIGTGNVSNGKPDCSTPVNSLHITFKRPNPEAIICGIIPYGSNPCPSTPALYSEITISGSDGSTRKLTISSNGQMSVQ